MTQQTMLWRKLGLLPSAIEQDLRMGRSTDHRTAPTEPTRSASTASGQLFEFGPKIGFSKDGQMLLKL